MIGWLAAALACLLPVAVLGAEYQSPRQFLAEAFAGDPPRPQALWIRKPMRTPVRRILGHPLGVLRVRYWAREGRSAWILEQVGKERPITTGIVIQDGAIARIRVLAFRESRGDEVRYPFFTDQFLGTRLRGDLRLDRQIDGISGATLSVRALKRLARLALYLDRQRDHDSP